MRSLLTLIIALIITAPLTAQIADLQQAAWKGETWAMLELSKNYRFGLKVEKNEDSAAYYVRKAAEAGDPDGQYLLGNELVIEIFDRKKFSEGMKLLKKAADTSHTAANWRLSEIFADRGSGTESAQYHSPSKAYKYAEVAAESGHKQALVYCAEARLKGRGTTRNDSIGAALMRRAADERKFIPAQLRMGDLYWEGRVNGKQEPFKAHAYYFKVLKSERSNIDQRQEADLGVHKVDQLLKATQNAMLNASGLSPTEAFNYRLRK